jgi:periplasmic divalent cation tolerance protein
MDASGHRQVQVTASSAEEAARLGRLAVERRMAACAQVSGPVESTYWWEGEVTSATEWVCTLKTTAARLPALAATLRAAHSYEVPEIVATALVDGDPDYLAWVEAETIADGAGDGPGH